MRLWPQSSQRSTCPPSAAERHCSIADITWSSARLTCPALALRQSAPWRSKTSATSSRGRRTAAGLSLGSRRPLDQWCQPVEWAGYGPDRRIGEAGVKRRSVELGATQKRLDHANIDILLEKVGGEAVPQRVRRHALLDPRGLGGGTDGAAELAGRQRLDRVAARKQPASRQQQAAPTPLPPPGAQQFEELWREHRVAVPRFREGRLLRPLPRPTRSSMRSESISLTLSATTSETRSPAPEGGGECRPVLWRCCRAQQQCHLLDAEHRRYPPRLRYDGEPARQVRPVERHGEEETQGRDRAVDARRLHAALRLVQLEETQVFRRRRVGRAADEGRE